MNRQTLTDLGYDDVILLEPKELDEAIVGISHDNRAIYDYDLLVKSFIKCDNISEDDAIEWIDHNTIRSLPYQVKSPIIMYNLKDF